MKQLRDVEYPRDFVNPKMAVAGDATLNDLIRSLSLERCKGAGNTIRADYISTKDTLVMLNTSGFVEVYKLVAQCEVEVPW